MPDGLNHKPRLPASPKSKANRLTIGCVSLGCGLPILIAIIVGVSAAIGGSHHDYDANNSYEAKAQCESRVKDLLKSPSTAKFNDTATGSGTWTVKGTVDSENGFGAMLRSSFQCTVVVSGSSLTTTVDYLG